MTRAAAVRVHPPHAAVRCVQVDAPPDAAPEGHEWHHVAWTVHLAVRRQGQTGPASGPTTTTAGPTAASPARQPPAAPQAGGPFAARIARSDDDGGGAPCSTVTHVYNSPYPGHTEAGKFDLGQSVTVVCQVSGGSVIALGSPYRGPTPHRDGIWYKITYNGAWAPAVYVDVPGSNVPTCP